MPRTATTRTAALCCAVHSGTGHREWSLLGERRQADLVCHHHHHHYHHHHHHQSLNREGRWGTTDDFATSFLHFSLFSTALWDLPNSMPVHSLMLSCHLFLCPPCLLPPFTVPCKMVLARSDERETWPYHCSLRLLRSSADLRVVRLPAESLHGLPRWLLGLCMRCVVSCGSTSWSTGNSG